MHPDFGRILRISMEEGPAAAEAAVAALAGNRPYREAEAWLAGPPYAAVTARPVADVERLYRTQLAALEADLNNALALLDQDHGVRLDAQPDESLAARVEGIERALGEWRAGHPRVQHAEVYAYIDNLAGEHAVSEDQY
jgi:hypothetical protein